MIARKSFKAAATLGALIVALTAASYAQQTNDSDTGAATRPEVLVPLPGQQLRMHTIVLRPEGPGPFPLAVINHGSTQNSRARAEAPLPVYPSLEHWLLERGYVVALPIRPGHGTTAGPYLEDQGRCAEVDYVRSGRATAASIAAAIDNLTAEPYIRKSGVLVLGQSAGGWGGLALASNNPSMVRAFVNFAGGRGGHVDGKPNNNCAPERLVDAAGVFGETARLPTLWLYAENDSYFPPELSGAMYKAFAGAGGRGEYHLLPAFGLDGHYLAGSRASVPLWSPFVSKFLAEHP